MRSSPKTDLFSAFRKCSYKAHLLLTGRLGAGTNFQKFQDRLAHDYHERAKEHLLNLYRDALVVDKPDSLQDAMEHHCAVITDAVEAIDGIPARVDALVSASRRSSVSARDY